MLKWLKEFTLKVLKLAVAAVLLLLLVNGLEFSISFDGNRSKEKSINMLNKVKEGITVASSINQFFK